MIAAHPGERPMPVPSIVSTALLAIAGTAAAQPVAARIEPVQLTASDGVTVWGAFYAARRPRATILLFHQAGSGKGEYASIAPRLAAAGYDALAIDQRVGGSLFGRNETAARIKGKPGYAAAQRDLEAALAWGVRRGRPVILGAAVIPPRSSSAWPPRTAGISLRCWPSRRASIWRAGRVSQPPLGASACPCS